MRRATLKSPFSRTFIYPIPIITLYPGSIFILFNQGHIGVPSWGFALIHYIMGLGLVVCFFEHGFVLFQRTEKTRRIK
jgi:hypothetical protein